MSLGLKTDLHRYRHKIKNQILKIKIIMPKADPDLSGHIKMQKSQTRIPQIKRITQIVLIRGIWQIRTIRVPIFNF